MLVWSPDEAGRCLRAFASRNATHGICIRTAAKRAEICISFWLLHALGGSDSDLDYISINMRKALKFHKSYSKNNPPIWDEGLTPFQFQIMLVWREIIISTYKFISQTSVLATHNNLYICISMLILYLHIVYLHIWRAECEIFAPISFHVPGAVWEVRLLLEDGWMLLRQQESGGHINRQCITSWGFGHGIWAFLDSKICNTLGFWCCQCSLLNFLNKPSWICSFYQRCDQCQRRGRRSPLSLSVLPSEAHFHE